MRRQVQYTLALTRWFVLEGERCSSVEGLWSDLVFVAQKLGFSYVHLTLADGQRVWEQANGGEPSYEARHELQGGRFGILVVKAPACESGHEDPASRCPRSPDCERPLCPCISEVRAFEVISDLLAEGWAKAAMKLNGGQQKPLRFDGRVSLPRNQSHPRFSGSYAPARVSEAEPKPINTPLNDPAG
jgi:hypothetical protein